MISWIVTALSVSCVCHVKRARFLIVGRQIQTGEHLCTFPQLEHFPYRMKYSQPATTPTTKTAERLRSPQPASRVIPNSLWPNCCLLRNNDHRVWGLQMRLCVSLQQSTRGGSGMSGCVRCSRRWSHTRGSKQVFPLTNQSTHLWITTCGMLSHYNLFRLFSIMSPLLSGLVKLQHWNLVNPSPIKKAFFFLFFFFYHSHSPYF